MKAIKLNESTISMVLGALVIIVVGVLVVNYFRDRGSKGSLPLFPSGNKTEATINQSVKTHKVSKGETLWSISEKYFNSGYNWVDIAKENKLANPGMIKVDQELTIPQVEAKQPTLSKVETSVKSAEPITGATYEVVKGDNLWTISVRAYGDGFKWVDIAKENKLVRPNLIHPGNILVLPR